MKATNTKAGLLAFVLAIFMLTASGVKAQCSTSKIQNNLSCSIVVDIEVHDTPSGCATCNFLSQVTIGANSGYHIPCGNCGNICNISVHLTDIGGGAVGPYTISQTGGYPAGLTGPCGASQLTYIPSSDLFVVQ